MNDLKYLTILSPIFFIFFYLSCEVNVKNFETVMQISSLNITKYEYEKNKNLFSEKFLSQYHREPSSVELKNWKKEYIDDIFLLSYLYEIKVDTMEEIINGVSAMERVALTQPSGFVEKYFIDNNIYDKHQFYKHINSHIFYEIDSINCNLLFLKTPYRFMQDYKKDSIMNEFFSSIPDLKTDTLMLYNIKDNISYMNVEEFLNYFKKLIVKPIIFSPEGIKNLLIKYVAEEYMIELADSIGIINKKTYLLDKKNYKNRIMLAHFKKTIFPNSLFVDSLESTNFYKTNLHLFIDGESADIRISKFDNKMQAYSYWKNSLVKNFDTLGIVSSHNEENLIGRKSKLFPQPIIDEIFTIKDNSIIPPFEFENQFYVILKKEEKDSILLPYYEVNKRIINKLKKEKSMQLIQNLIDQIKNNCCSYQINLAE